MGCGSCGKSRRNIEYKVKYHAGGESTFKSLREAQDDLKAHQGEGRISKVRY